MFAETFTSQANVEANGGVVTGSPTFGPATGVTLSGSSQYIKYDTCCRFFDSNEVSVVMEFVPHFDADVDAFVDLFSSSADNDRVLKRNNSPTANVLRIRLGGTTIEEIPYATYSPHWVTNGRNVLVISSTSGNTSVYLNGITILDADATAWSNTQSQFVYIGSKSTGANYFDGEIRAFKIFCGLLTAEEAAGYYNQDIYGYESRALINLPMTMAEHDPTNSRSLNRGTLGAAADAHFGATNDKLTWSRGYKIDNNDDALSIPDQTDLRFGGPTESFTVAAHVRLTDPGLSTFVCGKDDAVDDGYQMLIRAAHGFRFSLNSTDFDSNAALAQREGLMTLVASVDREATCELYHNGKSVGSGDATGISMDTTSALLVGTRNAATALPMEGDLLHFAVWNFALTPMQVVDLHQRWTQEVNKI